MEINIIDLNANLNEGFKELAEKKINRFENIFGKNSVATLKVKSEKNSEKVEITIKYEGRIYRTENESDDKNKSLDLSLDLLARKIDKHKTKIEKSFRTAIPENFSDFVPEENIEKDHYSVTRVKTFPIKPMSIEEAILQMNLVGHKFFMFRNQDSNEINVIYKRKNETYGLLVPEV